MKAKIGLMNPVKLFTHALLVFFLHDLTPVMAAGDAKKGEELFKQCIACHGGRAEGNKEQKAPKLQGQHEWYLLTSLQKFKKQERKNPPMLPFVAKLSDQDFSDLAAYIITIK